MSGVVAKQAKQHAHQQGFKVVACIARAAYGYTGKPDDASRVAFLFKEYQKLTAKASVKDDEK